MYRTWAPLDMNAKCSIFKGHSMASHARLAFRPRLVKKAQSCAKELDSVQESIATLNSEGVLSGFTNAYFVCA